MEQRIEINGVSKIGKVLLLLLFLFNNETLANNLCTWMQQPTIIVVGMLFAWFVVNGINKHYFRHVDKGSFVAATALSVCAMIVFFIDNAKNGYILLAMALLSSFAITTTFRVDEFEIEIVKISKWISLYSLICTYILKIIAPKLGFIRIVRNSAGTAFYNFIFCYVHTGTNYYRNYGVFREPGVYAYFLCLALLFLILKKKHFDQKDFTSTLVILVITLITTFSTTGYIAILVILIWVAFVRKELNYKLAIILSIATVALIVFSNNFIDNPLSKLNANSSSYLYRIESIKTAMNLIIKRPLGYGINIGLNEMATNYGMATFHNTNTWTTLAVYFGIPFMVITTLGMIMFIKKTSSSLVLLVPFIFLLSGEMLVYNPFVYVLIIYGYKKIEGKEYESVRD